MDPIFGGVEAFLHRNKSPPRPDTYIREYAMSYARDIFIAKFSEWERNGSKNQYISFKCGYSNWVAVVVKLDPEN